MDHLGAVIYLNLMAFSGVAGYVAAIKSAQLGLKVGLGVGEWMPTI